MQVAQTSSAAMNWLGSTTMNTTQGIQIPETRRLKVNRRDKIYIFFLPGRTRRRWSPDATPSPLFPDWSWSRSIRTVTGSCRDQLLSHGWKREKPPSLHNVKFESLYHLWQLFLTMWQCFKNSIYVLPENTPRPHPPQSTTKPVAAASSSGPQVRARHKSSSLFESHFSMLWQNVSNSLVLIRLLPGARERPDSVAVGQWTRVWLRAVGRPHPRIEGRLHCRGWVCELGQIMNICVWWTSSKVFVYMHDSRVSVLSMNTHCTLIMAFTDTTLSRI